ncbi:hypothetical protein [Paraburkholderia guartelaensis]|uniref:hypothetical protein n=1 Tax=Paraburkholderia guartelaensis TaxID=2546446 RepID=UPI002AB79D4F|nr:hypothetical protein [Paraburkholderia guartelaensis]
MMSPLLSALEIDPSHLIASLLVCFYAWKRFNTPNTVRSQTSQFQYYGSGVTYVASCEGVLLLMTWVLKENPGLLEVFHTGSEGQVDEKVTGLDAPVVAALMLTTLLPTFPVLRDLDAKMLAFFHRMGAIPFNALRWSQRLGCDCFTVTDSGLERAKQYVRGAPDLQDDLALQMVNEPGVDRMRYAFTEVAVLYVTYRDLDIQPRFGNAFPDVASEFESRMANFFAHCLGYFATTAQLSSSSMQPAPDAAENIRKVILAGAADVRLMLARVLLSSCINDVAVAQKFRKMGFAIPASKRIQLPYNLLCLDLLGVVSLFSITTWLSAGAMPVEKAFAIGLLVAVNHVTAAALALLPKQVWNFADICQAKERPILAYFLSALAAFTVGLAVSYCFYGLRVHYLVSSGPILPFPAQCKWLLLSTMLAFALAFECDNYRSEAAPPWLRWVEGAGLAMLMAATGAFVVHWLRADQLQLHPHDMPPKLWLPIGLSAAIGALFGSTIPHWYRACVSQIVKPPGPDLPPTHSAIQGPGQTTGKPTEVPAVQFAESDGG